jgi:thioredoxin reductase (NADPH)
MNDESLPTGSAAEPLDCLVIGGGPGGLMTAVYLARFKRRCLVVDAGSSRLKMIAKTRNVLGFPDGINGGELLERVRQQAMRYGVEIRSGSVQALQALADGGFEASDGESSWRARTVVLATGALDVQPQVEELEHGLAHALVRYCPVCDGFESQGRRVAVLGQWEHGQREADFIAGFGNEVTWLSMQTRRAIEQEEIKALKQSGVRIVDVPPRAIRCVRGEGVEIELADGEKLRFDMLYSALGLRHASQLATALGAQAQENGQLVVDEHLRTTVAGLYAVGDVAASLNQINIAAGHAAIAATAIHNSL